MPPWYPTSCHPEDHPIARVQMQRDREVADRGETGQGGRLRDLIREDEATHGALKLVRHQGRCMEVHAVANRDGQVLADLGVKGPTRCEPHQQARIDHNGH